MTALKRWRQAWLLPLLGLLLIAMTACASQEPEKVLYIGGIPDQDLSVLQARFNQLADYLTEKTGVMVKYQPSVDYAALVTAFKNDDLQMGWYGGLTGVQARLAAPNAQAIAQRPRDEEFYSVFVKQRRLDINSLADVNGKSLTFGSESSTSGYLMPRHFLTEAGIDLEQDLEAVNFSGSHDKTWKLVESGAYQVGALNEAVWQSRLQSGEVDTSKVEVFFTTPPYYDYHWVIRGDVDEEFGEGFLEKVQLALLELDASNGGRQREIMEAFQAQRFITTTNANYKAIEDVARQLGIIES